jgi:plasmid stabilization system protein ParE
VKRIILRQSAEDDIDAAFTWYEQQRPGLGSEFLLAVEAGLAAIRRQPEIYPAIYKRARRQLLRRFPYALFFVDGESIEVIACMHARRHPRHWRGRA